jgi:hypothetical protein
MPTRALNTRIDERAAPRPVQPRGSQREVPEYDYFTISLLDATFACVLPALSVA